VTIHHGQGADSPLGQQVYGFMDGRIDGHTDNRGVFTFNETRNGHGDSPDL
jgi:hypothetical protein